MLRAVFGSKRPFQAIYNGGLWLITPVKDSTNKPPVRARYKPVEALWVLLEGGEDIWVPHWSAHRYPLCLELAALVHGLLQHSATSAFRAELGSLVQECAKWLRANSTPQQQRASAPVPPVQSASHRLWSEWVRRQSAVLPSDSGLHASEIAYPIRRTAVRPVISPRPLMMPFLANPVRWYRSTQAGPRSNVPAAPSVAVTKSGKYSVYSTGMYKESAAMIEEANSRPTHSVVQRMLQLMGDARAPVVAWVAANQHYRVTSAVVTPVMMAVAPQSVGCTLTLGNTIAPGMEHTPVAVQLGSQVVEQVSDAASATGFLKAGVPDGAAISNGLSVRLTAGQNVRLEDHPDLLTHACHEQGKLAHCVCERPGAGSQDCCCCKEESRVGAGTR